MGGRKGAYSVLWGDLRQRDQYQNVGLDNMIILKRIFKKWHGEVWTGLIWLRIATGSIKSGNSLTS